MSKEKVLIAGGSGLVGQFLADDLYQQGYAVSILSRSAKTHPHFKYYKWDVTAGVIEDEALEVDHIINLTGAGIADKRWTDKRKKEIIDSRVDSTMLIKKGLTKKGLRLKSYTSASAIGIYGDRGDVKLTESTVIEQDSFMVECCIKWEEAAQTLDDVCDRLCIIRIGIVISSKGGALQKFILPIKLGQANYFGDGQHYYSWIHIEDLSKIFYECISNASYSGIINGVTPSPLTNKAFMIACKKAIASYALVYPVPKFMMKLFLGEMSAVILNSNRVIPSMLEKLGFTFTHPDLENAVNDVIKREV